VLKFNRLCFNVGYHVFRNRLRIIFMMLVYVSKLDFQANLCEAFAKVKKAALLWKLRFGMGSFTKDSQTISEQDFTQNVGEVSSSIYLAVY